MVLFACEPPPLEYLLLLALLDLLLARLLDDELAALLELGRLHRERVPASNLETISQGDGESDRLLLGG